MPITVTMLQRRQGEDGTPWLAGQSYSASIPFGTYLITSNLATGTIALPPVTSLSPADNTAVKALLLQADFLTAPGNLAGVIYDGSNRAVQWTIDGVTYTANYSGTGITVAGSDGTITSIGIDPAQRITSVTDA